MNVPRSLRGSHVVKNGGKSHSVRCARLSGVPRNQRGFVLLTVLIVATVVIGFAGLAIDTGRVRLASSELQAIADAAVLGAVLNVKEDVDVTFPLTRATAVAIGRRHSIAGKPLELYWNASNDVQGDIVVGRWNDETRSFEPTLLDPDAVKITARLTTGSDAGPLPLMFGKMFGVQKSEVSRTAVAITSRTDPHILVLDPYESSALKMSGGATVDSEDGSIHVNSNSSCGATLSGGAIVDADGLSTVGNACLGDGSVTGTVKEGAKYIEDPLLALLPDAPAWNAFKASMPRPAGPAGMIKKSGTFEPGYYPRGLQLVSYDRVTLREGEYMFGGKGITMTGHATLQGENITLFIDEGASVSVTGSANLLLKAAEEGPYAGITIFTHRENVKSGTCKITGGGKVDIGGIIYVPSGETVLSGSGESWQIGGLISDTLTLSGQSTYIIPGDLLPADWPRTGTLVH